MMTTNTRRTALLMGAAVALIAAAPQGALAQDEGGFEVKWEPAPSIRSADGLFEMNLRGRIYMDSAWISDNNNTIDVKATELRAARLGIEGKAWKDIKYKFEVDFSGDETEVKDAHIDWATHFGPTISLGQMKLPNSLDEQTSSRHISVMERSSFTDAFSLSRRLGIAIGFGGDNWTAKVGAYRGANNIEAEDEGTEFAGRVTYSPEVGSVRLHLGASFRSREQGDLGAFRYRQRPHQHLSPVRFVDTGSIADSDTFLGGELAAMRGPLWVAAEYANLKADAIDPLLGKPSFSGGYMEAGYFITGESRVYKPEKGAWDRPKVNNPVHAGGSGAVAVVLRYDTIDLSDNGLQGGKQNTVIAGVNWYLNRHVRLLANYNHSSIKDSASAGSLNGRNKVDGFGLRAQVDW